MKIYIIIIYALLISCSKEEIVNNGGETNAIINGTDWEWPNGGTFYQITDNEGRLFFSLCKSNEFEEQREKINFNHIDSKISNDTIFFEPIKFRNYRTTPDKPVASFINLGSDGDTLGAIYEVLESNEYPSWLLLDKISRKKIKGTFQLYLIESEDSFAAGSKPRADTLLITGGEFIAVKTD